MPASRFTMLQTTSPVPVPQVFCFHTLHFEMHAQVCRKRAFCPPRLCQVATGNSGNNKVRANKDLLMRGKFGHILPLPSRKISQHSTVHLTHTESPHSSICLIEDETFMQLQKAFPSLWWTQTTPSLLPHLLALGDRSHSQKSLAMVLEATLWRYLVIRAHILHD